MKHQYFIAINGEGYLYDLNIVQAYWIAAALFIAGYWQSYKRVRVVRTDCTSRLYTVHTSRHDDDYLYQLGTMSKRHAAIIVAVLKMLGYSQAYYEQF